MKNPGWKAGTWLPDGSPICWSPPVKPLLNDKAKRAPKATRKQDRS